MGPGGQCPPGRWSRKRGREAGVKDTREWPPRGRWAVAQAPGSCSGAWGQGPCTVAACPALGRGKTRSQRASGAKGRRCGSRRSRTGRQLLRGTLGLLRGDMASPPFGSQAKAGEGGWPLQTAGLAAPASSPAGWGEASSGPRRLEGALGAPAVQERRDRASSELWRSRTGLVPGEGTRAWQRWAGRRPHAPAPGQAEAGRGRGTPSPLHLGEDGDGGGGLGGWPLTAGV